MKINLKTKQHPFSFTDENYVEEPFEKCPFCGSMSIRYNGNIHSSPDINIYNDFLKVIETEFSNLPAPDIKIYSCKSCHIGFFNPQPGEKILKELYANFEIENNTKKETDCQRLANHITGFSKNFIPAETINILDFGGGSGMVSKFLGQNLISSGIAKKIKISVVDFQYFPDKIEEPVSMRWFQTPAMINPEEKFDIIIASAVFEHVKDPKHDILLLLNMLGDGGILYARTPWSFPFFRLFRKVRLSFGMPYPAHLFDMGGHFWSGILNTLKLSEFRIRKSHTSIVHASFRKRPIIALLSHLFKLPSYLIGKWYPYSGGWEVVIERR